MFELVPIFGIVFGTVSSLAIVWVIGRTRQRRYEVQAQVQTKLIDRFGSTPELIDFAHKLERSVIETIESGTVTKDLAQISQPPVANHATTEGFIGAIAERLRTKVGAVAGAR